MEYFSQSDVSFCHLVKDHSYTLIFTDKFKLGDILKETQCNFVQSTSN